MNHISILIVDDDLNKIALIIKTIREDYSDALSINQASCVQEAIENLQKKDFHLLITDLQMPLKHDDIPNNNGGESLIRSIYKGKNKANVPLYIVGLTQFEELKKTYAGVWMIWHFDSSNSEWKGKLRDLIFHISLVKARIITTKIETIFVEGPTDKKILETAIGHYYNNLRDKVYIDTIKYGGGAFWVERQLFIWAKSLSKNINNDSYLKAVGILDNDSAGNKAIDNLRNLIELDSAESKTFSILKNSYQYSPLLKSIKRKGISFPTTVEDLISIDCWKIAEANSWLESRNTKHFIIDESILEFQAENINSVKLIENKFDEDEVLIITKQVKDEFKVRFCNLVCESDKKVLESIKYLLKEIFEKLKIEIACPI